MLDLRPMRMASFRHLAVALWVNEFGNWMGEVALALLVYDQTRSALATAALFLALRFLPALLSPLLTTRAESLRPRIVLPIMYLLEAALFSGIALASHHFSLAVVLVLVVADGILAITSTTLTRSALATGLIEARLLREGNGLLNLGAMVAIGGSPVIAASVVAWRGAATALLIDAATFLIAAFTVATAKGLRIESDREIGFAGRIRAGADVLRRRRPVRRLLIATALCFGLSQIAIPIEVVFATKTLHAGPSGYGLLLTCWGVGMILGAAVFTVGANVRLLPLLGFSTALIAIGYGGLALSPTIAVACAFSCVGGAGNGAAWVAAKTALQERIPLVNQSAVMSVLDSLNQVLPAIGFVIGGAVTALSSPRVAYALSAAGVAGVLIFFLLRPMNRVQFDDTLGQSTPSVEGPDVASARLGEPGSPQDIDVTDRNFHTFQSIS